MEILEELIIMSLVTWRISSMLAQESGPLAIFHKLRELIGVEKDGTEEAYGKNWFAEGIICIWCNSVWVSCLLVLCLGGASVEEIVVKTLAFSAGAIGVNKIYG